MDATESALLAAVLAEPDDDNPRKAYADLLMERGDPRGEFILVQCDLARYIDMSLEPARSLRRREVALVNWRAFAGPAVQVVPVGAMWPDHITLRRGFVDAVTTTAELWLAHGDAVLAAHPVREVTLTTRPKYGFIAGPGRRYEGPPDDEFILADLRAQFPRVKTWHLPAVDSLDRPGEWRVPVAARVELRAGDMVAFDAAGNATRWEAGRNRPGGQVLDIDPDGRGVTVYVPPGRGPNPPPPPNV